MTKEELKERIEVEIDNNGCAFEGAPKEYLIDSLLSLCEEYARDVLDKVLKSNTDLSFIKGYEFAKKESKLTELEKGEEKYL